MSFVTDVRVATGLAVRLRSLLRQRLTLSQAADVIRRRLEQRENNFLSIVERGIFGFPASPYLPLLAGAGCVFADIEQMVRTRGLEQTLTALRDAGVYITFEEFKGRTPIIRHGRTIAAQAAAFANPLHRPHFWKQSSGSTGRATHSSIDIAGLMGMTAYLQVSQEALGLTGAPRALWRGPLPAGAGIAFALTCAATGNPPRRWFTPVAARDLTSSWKYTAGNSAILALARMYGAHVPSPEYVPFDRALVIAQWAADTVKAEGRCFLSVQASAAVRMCLAAAEAGINLTGTTISGGGEPMTGAKAKPIASVGVRCRQNYFTSETGALGYSCGNPKEEGDVHLLADSVVLTQAPRQVPGTSITVDAFQVTTLLPSASYVLLNVELDDYGVVEDRSCGCLLGSLGLTRHLRQIRSFRKLTGEGVTLVGGDMERILTEVLPARFGGTPLDYQLVEDEDARGFTRLHLAVSPRLQIDDPAAVVETVMQALSSSGAAGDHARAHWQQAGTLEIVRREPTWTAAGKLMPLHLTKQGMPMSVGKSG